MTHLITRTGPPLLPALYQGGGRAWERCLPLPSLGSWQSHQRCMSLHEYLDCASKPTLCDGLLTSCLTSHTHAVSRHWRGHVLLCLAQQAPPLPVLCMHMLSCVLCRRCRQREKPARQRSHSVQPCHTIVLRLLRPNGRSRALGLLTWTWPVTQP